MTLKPHCVCWNKAFCANMKPRPLTTQRQQKEPVHLLQNDELNHYEQKQITRIDTNMAADCLLTFTGIVMNTFT